LLALGAANAPAADPAKVADIGKVELASSPISNKGIVYFPVLNRVNKDDGSVVYSGALWQSDGTSAGTKKVKDFGEGTSIVALSNNKGKIYLGVSVTTKSADGSTTVAEQLHISDGTEKGTTKLADFGAGTAVDFLTPIRELVDFAVTTTKTNSDGTTTSSSALWKSDGTAAGTKVIKDLGADVTITGVQMNKGTLYMTVKTVVKNSDGTTATTYSVWKY